MTTLSVIIPALDEEDSIAEIVHRVLSAKDGLAAVGIDDLELIVVDDGSTDRTADIVRSIDGADIIEHETNRGYGAALKTGFSAARGEWVGFLDADGTYPPEYFPKLCAYAMEHDSDIVVGSRMSGESSEMPTVRRLGNVVFARLVSILSAQQITDSASGMRVFKKSVLEQLYPLPDGLNLTPVMSTRALHENLQMDEVPIPYSERAGRSKLSAVHDGLRFGQSIVWTGLNYNPVRLLGIIGLILIGLAGVVGIGLVVVRLSGVQYVGPVGAFTLFSALVFGVAGISILTLGISFNYYVALFHKSPVRQGLFGKRVLPGRADKHFGWVGVGVFVVGIVIAVASLVFALRGWTMEQLWIYYLISASFALVGIQLIIAWVQMQVLEALRVRDELVAEDMHSGVNITDKPAGGTRLSADAV